MGTSHNIEDQRKTIGQPTLIFPCSTSAPFPSKSHVTLMGLMGIGVMTSWSRTPVGTVSIIRPKSSAQVSWNASVVMPYRSRIVWFPSLLYSRKSEREVSLKLVTRGPPRLPAQSMYSWTTSGSNAPRVLSKLEPPLVLFGVTVSGPTTCEIGNQQTPSIQTTLTATWE